MRPSACFLKIKPHTFRKGAKEKFGNEPPRSKLRGI